MIIDTRSQLLTGEAIDSFHEEMAAGDRAVFKSMAILAIDCQRIDRHEKTAGHHRLPAKAGQF
jgi:hypothetical protein